ncbi:hypothetical protein DAEQUDRAFT_77307 [Daedalea quercina L-15889]|uniref:C2H2-type domain-containing protein n=1 Tax=Daedalea quercina L-15889 TaxID=1314783 RepID=A0A165SF83_9APHY|nr:hypothetical protein DAEQUDRAFT_77307 [Daedalea quercina L-15889]
MSTSTSSNSVYHYIEVYHAGCDACYDACYDAYYQTIRRIVDVFADNYFCSRTPVSPEDDIEFDIEAAAIRENPTLLPECWVSFYICPWKLDAVLGFDVPHSYVDDALRMVRGEPLAGPPLNPDDVRPSTPSTESDDTRSSTSTESEYDPTTIATWKAPVRTHKRKRALDDDGDETDSDSSGRTRSATRRIAPGGAKLLPCPFDGCSQVFKTKGDLNRHVTSAAKHNPEKTHRCPNPRCRKDIPRLDSFKRHFTAADDRCRISLFEDAGTYDLRKIPWEKYVIYLTSESGSE